MYDKNKKATEVHAIPSRAGTPYGYASAIPNHYDLATNHWNSSTLTGAQNTSDTKMEDLEIAGNVPVARDWCWSPEHERYYRYENNVQGDFSLPLSELLHAYVLYFRIVKSL
jgi:hypothetical protein